MPEPEPPEREYQTTCAHCEKPFRFRMSEVEFFGTIKKSTTAPPARVFIRCPACSEPNRIPPSDQL